MDQIVPGAERRSEPGALARMPIDRYLSELHARLSPLTDGEVATYIPELANAAPSDFGIALATTDGRIYQVGDCARPFTIQSVSKPFMYGHALETLGRACVLRRVGVEPTGEAFNSIVLDETANRPFNPMVNAGAIAVAGLMQGEDNRARVRNMLRLFGRFAGRDLVIDEAVFQSERATGHRNRAIAWMMLNTGMIDRAPEDILDLYFRQCSVSVNCADLALMAATLANHGVQPVTGDPILNPEATRDVLSVMHSCGMYNYAGEWSYEVGMPAKSGVSGCIIAVMPGQLGLAIYSPPLDRHGNSVRGIRVCQEMSRDFELHPFDSRSSAGGVIRREYDGASVRSNRLRTPAERSILDAEGRALIVLECQGSLYFGAAERLLRRIAELCPTAALIVIDLRRVTIGDRSSADLIAATARSMTEPGCRLLFAGLSPEGPLAHLCAALARQGDALLFDDADAALEWCEDRLLGPSRVVHGTTKYALAELDVLKGLDAAELRQLESIVKPLLFEPSQKIVREGDPAKLFFAIAKGAVSVRLDLDGPDGSRTLRLACLGPGLTFGEMALFDGGPRSADVVADEKVVCYGFSVDRLREISETSPRILTTILTNITREFSERLRNANRTVRALE
jgi:glutaminase